MYEYRTPLMKQDPSPTLGPWQVALIRQLPMFLLALGIVHTTIGLWTISYCLPQHGFVVEDITIKLLVALLPFLLCAMISTIAWPTNPKVFWFRYRVFFPAVLTCAISFVFGWSIQKEPLHLIIPVLFILFVGMSSFFDGLRPTILLVSGGGPLLALFIVQLFIDIPAWNEALEIWTLGFLMTLGMGVAESWKVMARTEAGLELIPPGDSGEAFLRRNRWGTNLATCVLPAIVTITSLHPAANEVYTYGMIGLAAVQYSLWFYFQRPSWSVLAWTVVSLVVGFLLPLMMIIGVATTSVPTSSLEVAAAEEPRLTMLLGMLAISLTIIVLMIQKLKPFDLADRLRRKQFALLVGVTCIILGLLILASTALVGPWPKDHLLGVKLMILLRTYVGTSFGIALYLLITWVVDQVSNGKKS